MKRKEHLAENGSFDLYAVCLCWAVDTNAPFGITTRSCRCMSWKKAVKLTFGANHLLWCVAQLGEYMSDNISKGNVCLQNGIRVLLNDSARASGSSGARRGRARLLMSRWGLTSSGRGGHARWQFAIRRYGCSTSSTAALTTAKWGGSARTAMTSAGNALWTSSTSIAWSSCCRTARTQQRWTALDDAVNWNGVPSWKRRGNK